MKKPNIAKKMIYVAGLPVWIEDISNIWNSFIHKNLFAALNWKIRLIQ